jgi:hypothetical protein
LKRLPVLAGSLFFWLMDRGSLSGMRAFLLIAGASLALSGCNRGAQTDNNQVAGDSLTAQNIVSNDVTAIDAVTGDAANMAADVDMNFGNLNEVGGTEIGSAPSRPGRSTATGSTNEVSNTTANTGTPATPATNAE